MSRSDLTSPSDPAQDAAFVAAVEAGQASLDSGRGIPYEDVRRWMLSWGTEKKLPPPERP